MEVHSFSIGVDPVRQDGALYMYTGEQVGNLKTLKWLACGALSTFQGVIYMDIYGHTIHTRTKCPRTCKHCVRISGVRISRSPLCLYIQHAFKPKMYLQIIVTLRNVLCGTYVRKIFS